MSVAVLPSDRDRDAAANALAGVRTRGGVAIAFKADADGRTRLADLHEWGGFRVKLPHSHGLPEAVLINTGGGLLGGDAVNFGVVLDIGTTAQIVSLSAERVYRSLGPACRIDVTLDVGGRARLHWLPQETILFNEARLRRTITAKTAADATLLMVEQTVFGRAAMGETVVAGSFHDTWRIWRGETLVYAESIDLSGAIAQKLGRAAIGAGAMAMATVLYMAPDAADRLDDARAALDAKHGRAAVSTWNGMLIGRLLAPAADALNADVARLATFLSGRAMPRVWGLM